MAVPPLKLLHRPFLDAVLRTQGVASLQQVRNFLVELFSLTEDDLVEKIPSGRNKFRERVYSSASKLRRAGLLQSPSSGHFQITSRGREFLTIHTGDIENSELDSMISEAKRQGMTKNPETPKATNNIVSESTDGTHSEQMDELYSELIDELADELLESVKGVSPNYFERLVVRLLEKMGYGEGEAIGRSGDGGIDGVINQDALGLEKVYIQAKRWQNIVGEPEIRNFSGSLDAKGASKGVFITTSAFSSTALQTAQAISNGPKFIRLIDGPELASLMIGHGVGMITEITYDVKKIDENYFVDL